MARNHLGLVVRLDGHLMMALLSPKLWLALALAGALAFSHFFMYRTGKAVNENGHLQAQIVANAEARRLEQRRQSMVDEAGAAAAKRVVALRADAGRARRESDGLRDDLGAVRIHAAQSLAAATVTVAALSDVFERCSRRYSELAEKADGHASDALTLQQAWPR